MRRAGVSFLVLACAAFASRARAAEERADAPQPPSGDLFPGAGHPTVAAASGLPFLAIGEIGIGVTNGFAIGAVAGITPSVVTAGARPRFRVALGPRSSLTLLVPMLYYPKASAPGPGNIGAMSWVLARPELFYDVAPSERWRVGAGLGIVAAASTFALGEATRGHSFRVPAYGQSDTGHGFAGGVWDTIGARSSYAFSPDTHGFVETSLVMNGVVPADNVGGPPVVVTVGVQRSF